MTAKKLEHQVAVVTGGGRGIGRATALMLARAGAAVVVTARTDGEIKETVQQIEAEGGRGMAMQADVSKWEQVEALSMDTKRVFSTPNLLVVNASVIEPVSLSWNTDPESWGNNIRVNLTGAYYTTRAFLPDMIAANRGKIVYISSGAASRSIPGWSAYCASKAGLDHFARNLAAELSSQEIPIESYIFYPGVVDTDMQGRIRRSTSEEFPQVDRYVGFKENGHLRHPDEPAQVILWLACGYASDLSGEIFRIDDEEIRKRVAADLGTPMLPP
jgi:NAD(P)-dependent dehydrogenase (short-subunit alcohol dehydrogenase family)